MSLRRAFLFFLLIVLARLQLPGNSIQAGDEWQPIDPADLKMTSEPKAPGAPAIYLYRQVDRDDPGNREARYVRIKILTEEGRKYANVELAFLKGGGKISDIQARTIQPDGKVVEFDGKIYEKEIVKARGVQFLTKTFTLPEAQVGSIVEYRYVRNGLMMESSRWAVSADLFTKHAKFSLKTYSNTGLHWNWHLLPPGTKPVREGNTIRLEVSDIPEFQSEDFMPPVEEVEAYVDFIYEVFGNEKEPELFWKNKGKGWNATVEGFLDRRKAMEKASGQIVSPGDAPEVKLRKIYDRVQQVRNTSFEEVKTEKELKREKQKDNTNVEEVWKHQYGGGVEISWLFLGLVRAAGFEAYAVLVSRRDTYFFKPALMNQWQLNDWIVMVKTGGKDLYFDPGTPYTPFGYLPWAETAIWGLRLDAEGGSWVTTSVPMSTESTISRTAQLKLTESGELEGKLTVTYTGLEAQGRRLQQRNADVAKKKEYLETEVKQWVPGNARLELTNQPAWTSSDEPLAAEFDFDVADWATTAGRRTLVPVGFFSAQEKHLFEHAGRVHPVYFEYPFEEKEDIKIEFPAGWTVKSLPPGQNLDQKLLAFSLKVEDAKGVAHVTRWLKLGLINLEQKDYGGLRNFFQQVKTADEQQIVVERGS